MTTPSTQKKKRSLSTYLSYIGNIALALMMLLTTADVLGRYFFNAPVLGAYEITEYLMLIMVFSFLALAQSQKAHINVDIVFNRLPAWLQQICERFNHIVCLLVMILVTWKSAQRIAELKTTGEASLLLKIPDYPFAIFLVIGCLVFCIEFFKDVFRSQQKDAEQEK
ncbi:DctQ2: C4-TRAP dicarbooxylate transporter [Desulfosarcina variabilis str. Montpellier]|uniref:TRAP transporter small permease n=1 Tax=Desulfosarcina variabilis TaxID=2300 RepID=UPI003AFB38E3